MISYLVDDPYRPGACNIGPAEIARRRRSAIVLTILALAVAAGMLVSGMPAVARLLVLPLAAAAAVTWLQVIRRFCVGFGVLGVRNFGELGHTESVGAAEARAADRRTALRMIAEGSAYGALVTALLVILPS